MEGAQQALGLRVPGTDEREGKVPKAGTVLLPEASLEKR